LTIGLGLVNKSSGIEQALILITTLDSEHSVQYNVAPLCG